jgi:hypothetical protein
MLLSALDVASSADFTQPRMSLCHLAEDEVD